jgi:hypothetical protein
MKPYSTSLVEKRAVSAIVNRKLAKVQYDPTSQYGPYYANGSRGTTLESCLGQSLSHAMKELLHHKKKDIINLDEK